MHHIAKRSKLLVFAVLVGIPMAACEQTPLDPMQPDGLRLDFASADDVRQGDGNILAEQFELCKTGTDATFLVEVVNNKPGGVTENVSYDVDVADGECLIVWESGGAPVDQVTVTEYVPAGYVASWTKDQLDDGIVTSSSGTGNQASGYVNGVAASSPTLSGVVVWFTNTPEMGGGEGCTPGFWKQRHHMSYWAGTGYHPSDAFTTPGFADAFPGETLGDVVAQGGGGIKALGRHAVAALLNAASPDVDYNLTAAEVVALFNDAYNGVTDINGAKDMLVMYNEQLSPICQ